jgi:hypothetical protein
MTIKGVWGEGEEGGRRDEEEKGSVWGRSKGQAKGE